MLFLSFVSCNKDSLDTVSSDARLLSVLENEITFLTEDGNNIYLKEFVYGSDGVGEYYAAPQEYTFIDFDGDGANELVVDISLAHTFYMIFYENNDIVYGFLINRRSLQSIKKDGSFVQTGAADVNYYCKLEFDKNTYRVINTAIKDEKNGIYEINGKKCALESVNEYIEDWNSKIDASWITIS